VLKFLFYAENFIKIYYFLILLIIRIQYLQKHLTKNILKERLFYMVKQHKTKNLRDGITVLSLCDGISCGRIALERAGFKVKKYYASEIKDIAIKVTQYNYPDTVQIGDVNNVRYSNGVLHTDAGDFKTEIDLVIFGSPCQTFSIAIPKDKRIGLNDLNKSGLFYQCNRILQEIKPTYFLMENVASMKESDKNIISSYLNIEPIKIDSKLVAPALRKRYYWTNIPHITQPKDKHIIFQSVLSEGYTDREKARCLAVIDSRPNSTPIKMFHRYYSTGFTTLIFKNKQHYKECVKEYERLSGGKRKIKAEELDNYTGNIFDGVRYMNQNELEKCQTIPEGYTKCLTRNEAANVIGDGWTVDTIAHIFSFIV
jgi:DNA (cytosine-5)-methyltransferase 3A